MKIKEITFQQLIQIRQYEPCTISATAIINEGDKEDQCMDKLKNFVQSELKKVYYAANPDKKPKEPIKEEGSTKTVSATPKNNIEEMPDL